jgi:WD40 repeat protein
MEKTLLIPDGLYARYLPTTGHIIYVRAGAVEAVPFSLATLQVTGKPVPVIENILSFSLGGTAQFAFSNNGLLVYASGGDVARSTPVWVDRQGNEESIDMPVQNYGTPKVSPDGERLAIVVSEPQPDIYVYDIATGRGTRLTLEGRNTCPVWTPDGERVTFSRRTGREDNSSLFWQPADGSGSAELLHSNQYGIYPGCWLPDGKLLTFVQVHPRSGHDIWSLALEGGRESQLLVGTEFGDNFPAFSPDGRWIAYMSKREGESRVYVGSYPTMDRPIPISYGPGEQPVWSPSGDEIFYRSRGKWVAASISTEPEFTVEDHQVLFEGPYLNVSGWSYDISPDGQRFLALKPQYDDSQIRELHVVTNWFEELKHRVPSSSEVH